MRKIVATAVIIASACGVFGGKEILAKNTSIHTVKKGDTLWDLSGNYLDNPLLWPKIWNINPGIANPHWIYPGQLVKIPGQGSTLAMDKSADNGVGPVASNSSALAKAGMASFSEPLPLIMVKKDQLQNEVQGKANYEGVPALDYGQGIGMLTNEIPSEGQVLHTQQGWQSAAVGEVILISAPGAPVGRQFGVYRDMGKVDSLSYYGTSPGHLLADIAIVEIVASDASGQRAVIRQAFAEVKTGDVLGRVQERTKVSPRPFQAGTATANGSVVAFHFKRQLAGPGDIVYLNIGANQGLVPGDLLSVAGTDQAAVRTSGEIMILRVAANTAAAVVTKRSAHEVRRGDVVGPPVM
ncbi:MAG: LysM peptidoglycan-binding domain-containing protein [Desulfurivibrionaceae bacterium]